MVICLERGADLHMAQLMALPLTVSCFSKIQIGFTFLVPAHPGSPGQRAAKRVCVCRWYPRVLQSVTVWPVRVTLSRSKTKTARLSSSSHALLSWKSSSANYAQLQRLFHV